MKERIWLYLLSFLLLVYAIGPQPATPKYEASLPALPDAPEALDQYIAQKEDSFLLKPGTRAQIIWSDSLRTKTEYALVYLHGFSASHHEGHPLHVNLANKFACNLYLSRLHDHGIDSADPLLDFSASEVYESAKEALSIGNQIGRKVILISTSTGGTLALKLAADFPDDVHTLINLSPNIKINDPFAFLLNDPWGLQIARLAIGGKYRHIIGGEEYARYWHDSYRVEALVQLQELLETTMTSETYLKVHQPVFNGYYYADEQHQDRVVRVDAILWMHDLLATPDSLKVLHAFPEAGSHVLASPIKSQDPEGVERIVDNFMREVLRMKPLPSIVKNS